MALKRTAQKRKTTDWDMYYDKPNRLALFLRKITCKTLIALIKKSAKNPREMSIAELGGGNSSYFDSVMRDLKPREFYAIDNNEIGIRKMSQRIKGQDNIHAINSDVFKLDPSKKFDLVYSIGLIEHFSGDNIGRIITKHFEILSDNGIAIISFPTPTFLYRITRFFAERLGIWIFYDEVPLKTDVVASIMERSGKVLSKKIIWPILLTQSIIVAKKDASKAV